MGPNRGGNNEQYALECLMSGGRDLGGYLPRVSVVERTASKGSIASSIRMNRPAAFWIRKVARS